MVITDICGLCGNQVESVEHIFFDCTINKRCWERLLRSKGLMRRARAWSIEKLWCLERLKEEEGFLIASRSCWQLQLIIFEPKEIGEYS